MTSSLKLFRLFGINVKIHITFLLLPAFFGVYYTLNSGAMAGIRAVCLVLFIFLCVIAHELCHSLVAKKYHIVVKDITLLPIGGVASMCSIPESPRQEFAISIAGPSFNLIFATLIFYPLYLVIGKDIWLPGLESWTNTLAYMFWINPVLAFFNLLPAFPMDGGRILRAVLARKMGYGQATKIAVGMGHTFSLIFGFLGILSTNIILILIAVFIYIAASQEGFYVDLRLTLRQFKVKDILPDSFISIEPDTTVSKMLELIFHTHQEDFPVVENFKLVGFVSRGDIISCVHHSCMQKKAAEIIRRDIETIKPDDSLNKAYLAIQRSGLKALPVVSNYTLKGIISLEDISRIYSVLARK